MSKPTAGSPELEKALSILLKNGDTAPTPAPASPGLASPPEQETPAEMLNRLGDDAQKWAQEFRATAMKLGYSDMNEDWLIGWFANAIEHSNDMRRWAREKADRETPATGLASPEALQAAVRVNCPEDCEFPKCACADEMEVRFLRASIAALAPYAAADVAAAVAAERDRIIGQIEALMAEQADNIVQNVREPIKPSPEANVRLAAQVEFLARWASTIRSGT